MNLEELRDKGNLLHDRLLSGNLTASAEIAEVFLPLIVEQLFRSYPNLDDPHLVPTAVEDALINYFSRPTQYNPDRLSLLAYLRMSARGDLLNSMKQAREKSQKLISIEPVEKEFSTMEQYIEVQDDFDLESYVVDRSTPIWDRLADLLPDPKDQEIVLLMMDRVRETKVYADVLGVSNLPNAKQAAIVKRNKDRIRKVLMRNIAPSELV